MYRNANNDNPIYSYIVVDGFGDIRDYADTYGAASDIARNLSRTYGGHFAVKQVVN
jgi:hypothetical protein